jgi:hypothetical protein
MTLVSVPKTPVEANKIMPSFSSDEKVYEDKK